MSADQKCPVCNNLFATAAGVLADTTWFLVDCPICGRFEVDREAENDFLDPQFFIGSKLTTVNRARIAHKLRKASTSATSHPPRLSSNFLSGFIKEGCPGPTPGEQVTNAIRFIGDEVSRTGARIERLPVHFFATIGAPTPAFATELLFELIDSGFLDGAKRQLAGIPPTVLNVSLKLSGWQTYESERKGKISGLYAFIAMKFGDADLDALVLEVIKPALKSELGFAVVDMRDIARAGVIDNIMRAQIRDAAFVLVDLTHDNSGAYWEAGYAEGLGKQVVYICEKEKFDRAQTHFDTNHCTTIVWSHDKTEQFKQQLIATLRRSLDLF